MRCEISKTEDGSTAVARSNWAERPAHFTFEIK